MKPFVPTVKLKEAKKTLPFWKSEQCRNGVGMVVRDYVHPDTSVVVMRAPSGMQKTFYIKKADLEPITP